MSRSSDLHLLMSDYERSYGEMEEKQRMEFALAYSKGRLPHQVRERFPCDDEQVVGRMPRGVGHGSPRSTLYLRAALQRRRMPLRSLSRYTR